MVYESATNLAVFLKQ